MISIGGIDPVKVIQQLISEMNKNLNLGIGYAIPNKCDWKYIPLSTNTPVPEEIGC